MNRLPIHMALVLALACSRASASRTLTFDDVASGTILASTFYGDLYRVSFEYPFRASDHSGSDWGPPHSGNNVAVLAYAPTTYAPAVLFGYYTPHDAQPDNVRSFGAYFSTQMDAVVRVTAYYRASGSAPLVPVASADIGALGQSWQNRYVELAPASFAFVMIEFEGVGASADLLGFCMDDMTISYVPEPPSLVALCIGAGALGSITRRHKRR